MKKILMLMLALMPLSMWAQDNTWERPEEEQAEEKTQKVNKDEKYLRGAVPEVDGKVVFSKTIEAPGKSADEIYRIIKQYMEKMITEKNQIYSNLVVNDAENHKVCGGFQEWLVFKSNMLYLDKTRLYFALAADCSDGKAELTLSRINYLYEEERQPQRIKAEEWITDKVAVNKKNTRLYPITGKFRRKTIDRKDYIFDKIESLLK